MEMIRKSYHRFPILWGDRTAELGMQHNHNDCYMQWGSLLGVDFCSAMALVRVCCLDSLCNQQRERSVALLIPAARSKTA